MKVIVNRQLCIGAGLCALTVPQVFDQDNNGQSVTLDPEPPQRHHPAVRLAQEICPVAAIRLSTTD